MAAQETYRIHETTKCVLREWNPTLRKYSDIAIVKSQSDRLLHLIYRDADRGFQYDFVTVKRYVVYLTPVAHEFTVDGRKIGEFSRLEDAEKTCAALNAAQQAEINKTARIEPGSINSIKSLNVLTPTSGTGFGYRDPKI